MREKVIVGCWIRSRIMGNSCVCVYIIEYYSEKQSQASLENFGLWVLIRKWLTRDDFAVERHFHQMRDRFMWHERRQETLTA